MLDRNELTLEFWVGIEVHGHVFTVKRQVRQHDAFGIGSFTHLYRRRVRNNLRRVFQLLLRVPELDALNACGRLDHDKWLAVISNIEYAAYRTAGLRMPRTPGCRPVRTDQRHILFQDDSPTDGVRGFYRFYVQCRTATGRPVYRLL